MKQPSTTNSTSSKDGLGTRLRALRKQRGLSLNDLGDSTQISASFLSLVENGKSDITIGRLKRLIDFYGISISDLIPSPHHLDANIMRRDERLLLHSPAEGIDVYLLVAETVRTMMPMLLEFEPGAGLAEYGSHAGEEFVHVLEGELLLDLDGAEPKVLKAGDSAYYMAANPHSFKNNRHTERLRMICVDSPSPL
jgi:transcriptional regulator with XRE-family HTH domain